MTALTPSIIGTPTLYSVSPALPGGLSLNTATGVISGTPTSASTSSSYVITASNSVSFSRFAISISVLLATYTDPSTGLIWQKCSYGKDPGTCDGLGTQSTQQNAINICNNLVLGGRSDWRLPNVNELQGLLVYGIGSPFINRNNFPNTNGNPHWTSTPDYGTPNYGYYVNFGDTGVGSTVNYADWAFYVRCVTGP